MLLRLRVVLLAVDAPALAVFLLLDAPLLFRADVAVGAGAGLARVSRAWPASSFAVSRVVSEPDCVPCSMRVCWLMLRCTSACMRCEEAEFGLPVCASCFSR